MFKLFKSSASPEVEVKQEPQQYNEIITTIHNEFNNASDILHKEAVIILDKNNTEVIKHNISKVDRLKSIGFNAANQVEEVDNIKKEIKLSSDTVDSINKARITYPLYKFITLEQILIICEKYDLIFGDISKYEGFVPDANLKEIEIFQNAYSFKNLWKIDETLIDMTNYEVRQSGGYYHFYKKTEKSSYNNYHFQSQNLETGFYASGIIDKKHYDTGDFNGRLKLASLQICAPLKDMNTKGMQIRNRILQNIPDPIVLQPIENGYLIVTAWGDEASDPMVRNNSILN